mmetsp:Transcript_6221/g.17776  ORF Transcript_6221/g.17776 Transcript_6221/m.17776 type:complete len:216 (-) Transcript_6221:211-858(-)
MPRGEDGRSLRRPWRLRRRPRRLRRHQRMLLWRQRRRWRRFLRRQRRRGQWLGAGKGVASALRLGWPLGRRRDRGRGPARCRLRRARREHRRRGNADEGRRGLGGLQRAAQRQWRDERRRLMELRGLRSLVRRRRLAARRPRLHAGRRCLGRRLLSDHGAALRRGAHGRLLPQRRHSEGGRAALRRERHVCERRVADLRGHPGGRGAAAPRAEGA